MAISSRDSEVKVHRIVTISNPQGLHARPADLFIKVASRFDSRIELIKGHERVDGKSIWAILTLAATEGTELIIEATGCDADEACRALAELVDRQFAEE